MMTDDDRCHRAKQYCPPTLCRQASNNVCPCNIRMEMYAGRTVCCLLASYVEYVPMEQTDRQTDARPLHYAFH